MTAILGIDVGGNNVKLRMSDGDEVRKVPSGTGLTATAMVEKVLEHTSDWNYDVISMGFPAPVLNGSILKEPINLGRGWVGFDFEAGFARPVKIVNDATMQALGSYDGGKMLFLGLGTGLGSTMVVEGIALPMELGHLPYKKGKSFEDYVGRVGMERRGKKKWNASVLEVVDHLYRALEPDYIVLGGGNTKKLKQLPDHVRVGDNSAAFTGAFRMWDEPVTAGA